MDDKKGTGPWVYRYYFKQNIQTILGVWIDEPRLTEAGRLLPLHEACDLVRERAAGGEPDRTAKVLLAILGCGYTVRSDASFLSVSPKGKGQRLHLEEQWRCGKTRGCYYCAYRQGHLAYSVLSSGFKKLIEAHIAERGEMLENLDRSWRLALMVKTTPHPPIEWSTQAADQRDQIFSESLLLLTEAARRFDMDHGDLLRTRIGARQSARTFEETIRVPKPGSVGTGSYHPHFNNAFLCVHRDGVEWENPFEQADLSELLGDMSAYNALRDAGLRRQSYLISLKLNALWNETVRTTVRFLRKKFGQGFANWIDLEAEWLVTRTHISGGNIKGGLVFEFATFQNSEITSDLIDRICDYISNEISHQTTKTKAENSREPLSLLMIKPENLTPEIIAAYLSVLTRRKVSKFTFSREKVPGKKNPQSWYKAVLHMDRLDFASDEGRIDERSLKYIIKIADYQKLSEDGRLAGWISEFETGGKSLSERDRRIKDADAQDQAAFILARSQRTNDMIMLAAHRLKGAAWYSYLLRLDGRLLKRFEAMDNGIKRKLIIEFLLAAQGDKNQFFPEQYKKMLANTIEIHTSSVNVDEAI